MTKRFDREELDRQWVSPGQQGKDWKWWEPVEATEEAKECDEASGAGYNWCCDHMGDGNENLDALWAAYQETKTALSLALAVVDAAVEKPWTCYCICGADTNNLDEWPHLNDCPVAACVEAGLTKGDRDD